MRETNALGVCVWMDGWIYCLLNDALTDDMKVWVRTAKVSLM